jgi:alkylhydroperoxidase family enzyme
MLEYARKLTITPSDIGAADIDRLRHAGFDDEAIGHIALTTAIYAMMNRVVDGLGDSLPQGMEREALHLGLIERESTKYGSSS